MTWHHWTVKKFLPLFIPRFHRRPVICFHANRDTNCKGRREKKGARGKSAHCTVAEQTFKGLLPGMRGGGGGDGDDVGGTAEGEKPLLDVEEEACRQRKDPSLSPSISLFLSLSIPPLVYLMQRRRNCIHFIMASLTKKNPQCRFLRRLTSLCQNAAMRRSSVDKLPPSASFFKTAASSSNTYALTQSPRALLSDNKNNR